MDVPSAVGGEQRIFLQGDEAIYERGGVLAELRDPFTRVSGLWVAAAAWCERIMLFLDGKYGP